MRTYLSSIKKIPIPLGIITLLVFFTLLVLLDKKKSNLAIQKRAAETPAGIRISNINSTGFTVSWLTKRPATGFVNYGDNQNLGWLEYDIRDTKKENKKYNVHYVVINKLQPQTKYYFKVISDGEKFGNGDLPFEITTAPILSEQSEYDLAQGRVLLPNLAPAEGVLVYLSLANSSLLSALTDSEGKWAIPLSTARTADLKNYLTYDKSSQIIEIEAKNEELSSSVTTTTGEDNPAPDIILGENYNFLMQKPTIFLDKNFGEIASPPEKSVLNDLLPNEDLSIVYPSDNEKITIPKPEFWGTGPKNQPINIQIESTQIIKDTITINSSGEWRWVPPINLDPGKHKITVTYKDKDGSIQTVSKIFTVLATEESNLPSFTSSPSGTLITPTISFTPTPTISISPSPTILLTISPTSSPTSAAAPRQTIPSTESGEIKPGISTPTFLLIGGGMLIMIGSILIFFL